MRFAVVTRFGLLAAPVLGCTGGGFRSVRARRRRAVDDERHRHRRTHGRPCRGSPRAEASMRALRPRPLHPRRHGTRFARLAPPSTFPRREPARTSRGADPGPQRLEPRSPRRRPRSSLVDVGAVSLDVSRDAEDPPRPPASSRTLTDVVTGVVYARAAEAALFPSASPVPGAREWGSRHRTLRGSGPSAPADPADIHVTGEDTGEWVDAGGRRAGRRIAWSPDATDDSLYVDVQPAAKSAAPWTIPSAPAMRPQGRRLPASLIDECGNTRRAPDAPRTDRRAGPRGWRGALRLLPIGGLPAALGARAASDPQKRCVSRV